MTSTKQAAPNQTPTKFNWKTLKKFSKELFEIDQKPLFGNMPPFNFQNVSSILAQAFQIPTLKVRADEYCYKTHNELLNAIDKPLFCGHIRASGVEGECYALLAQKDIKEFMAHLLKINRSEVDVQSQEIIDSFTRFLFTEALFATNSQGFGIPLTLSLSSFTVNFEPKAAEYFCQDIWIEADDPSLRILIRIVLPASFQKSWQKTFLAIKPRVPDETRLKEIFLQCSLEAGRVDLSLQDVLNLTTGNCIVLDHAFFSFDPSNAKINLSYQTTPLFRAKIEGNKIKITERIEQQEVQDSMERDLISDNIHDEHDDEHNEHEHTEEHFDIEDEEDPFHDDDDDVEDTNEDDFELEQIESIEEMIHKKGRSSSKAQQTQEAPEKVLKKRPTLSHPLSADKISMPVTIEIARLEMSAQELITLAPGNVLNIEVTPENGVDIVVHGKRIGRGELVQIGEALGVRVLEIATSE